MNLADGPKATGLRHLNISMTDWIALTEFHGLLGLLLTGDEHGPSFDLNGVKCAVADIAGRDARFEAVCSDFGFAAVLPGWYGDYSTTPIHIIIVGDVRACLQWLPISRDDKCALIDRLPFDEIDKTMCRLSV